MMSEVSNPSPSSCDHKSGVTNPKSTTTSISWKSSMRSPFVGFNEVFNSFIPVHEKGLRIGFYNSIALIFLMFVLIIIYYCYWVLRPFLQPLVWAILCGSALHPFKHKLLLCSHNWIADLRTECRPITVGALLLPFAVLNNIVDSLHKFFLKYWKIFLFIGLLIGLQHYSVNSLETIHMFAYNSVKYVINVLTKLLSHLTDSDNTFPIITVTIGYLIALWFEWSDIMDRCLSFLGPFVWMTLFVNIVALIGTLGHILSIILVSIILIGLTKTLISAQSHSSASDQIDGLVKFSVKLKSMFCSFALFVISSLKNRENDDSSQESEDNSESSVAPDEQKEFASIATSPITVPNIKSASNSRRDSLISTTNSDNKFKSNNYLYAVLWAVVLVQIWSHRNLIYLASIPIILKLLTIGWYYISSLIYNNIHRFDGFKQMRTKTLFHPFVRKAFHYFLTGDKVITDTIESSLNGLTSLSVICLTIFCILFAAVFMSIQIYGESLHLVNLMSNVFNNTINSYPESTQLLPESFKGVHEMLDEVVRNGYEYGRQYIKDSVKSAFNVDSNLTKTKDVEKQILEIWDRAYHLWLVRNANETDALPTKGPYDFDKLYNAFRTLDLNLCFNIVKENIDTLMSVLDSVWLLLKGNFTLLFTAIAAVFSTLLGGGLGLMNLVLSFIIFTTALFYLLSASGENYKPVELVNRIFPSEVTSQQSNSSANAYTNSKFGRAVEEAVNGVFAASLKISSFYGLYTWLIHVLFDVNIVYIPSVMAAMFGAVPFLSAFWASFPAFLELFFVQSQRTKAVLLLITAYFPSFLVDSTIYSEIKSAGHPYLTGLAIAGGVFYIGFEGALFGPILLCCLFVAFNMYSSIMQESSSPPNPMAPSDLTPQSTIRPSTSQFRRIHSLI